MNFELDPIKRVKSSDKYRKQDTKKNSEEKDRESNIAREPFWQRAIQAAEDKMVFEYGELPSDHAVQVYVEGLLDRLPKRNGVNLKIKVCPGWQEANACVIGDRTIYVGLGLLKDVKTEEALLGILAHENVHAYMGHAAKGDEKRPQQFDLKTLLTSISLERKQEYESDLRGALKDLEEAGVNPIGFKQWLMEQNEKKAWGSWTHGYNIDRALNISSAIYLTDLKSLQNGLSGVPNNIREEINEINFGREKSWAARPVSDYKGMPFSIEELTEKRYMAVDLLEPAEIPIAISKLSGLMRADKEKTEDEHENKKIMSLLTTRFRKEHIDTIADLGDRDKERLLGISLHTFARKTENDRDEFSWFPKNIEEFEKLRVLTEKRLPELGLDYFNNQTDQFFEMIVRIALKQGLFKDTEKDRLDREKTKEYLCRWIDTCLKLSETYDSQEPQKRNRYIRMVRGFLKNLPNQDKNWNKNIEADWPLADENISEFMNKVSEKAAEYGVDVVKLGSVDLTDIKKASKKIAKRIIVDFKEVDAVMLGKIMNELKLEVETKKYTLTKGKAGMDDEELYFQGMECYPYANFEIAMELVNNHPALVDLPKKERDVLLYSLACQLDLSISKNEIDSMPRDSYKYEKYKHIARGMNKVLSGRALYEEPADEKDLSVYFRYLGNREHENIFKVTDKSGYMEKKMYVAQLVEYLSDSDLSGIFEKIDRLEKQGIKVQEYLEEYPYDCGRLVEKIVAAIKQNSLKNINIKNCRLAGKWIANPFLQSAFERLAIEKRWPEFSFEEKLDLVFPEDGKGIGSLPLREKLLEEDMRTQEQFQLVRDRIEHNIDEFFAHGKEKQGLALLLDQNFKYHDVNRIIASLLKIDPRHPNMPQSDRQLKLLLYEMVSPGDTKADSIANAIRNTETSLRLIYSSDILGKQLILRKLLAGEGGALRSERRKKDFLNIIFDHFITKKDSEKDISTVLAKIKDALGETEEWELLYFAFQSTLSDKIAVPPNKDSITPYYDLYEIEEDLHESDIYNIKKFVNDIIWDKPPKVREQGWKKAGQYRFLSEEMLSEELEARGLLKTQKSSGMAPLDFVKDAAGKTGSIGVRFLQLLPQFAKLPEKRMEELSDVYDRVKGQIKPSAISLLEREWPGIWEEVAEVGNRIGGGSMVTVYRALMKNGSECVIKVNNPNIKFRLAETYEFARELLDRLAQKHGSGYRSARLALDDIRQWIEADADFTGFTEADSRFRTKYEGYRPQASAYSITIPKSFRPDNPNFCIEEYKPSVNLTHWNKLAKSGHDLKDITSALVKFYLAQLSEGQALSDLHQGNCGVTEDKQMVIYDRNFYLKVSPKERNLFYSLVNPILPKEERSNKLFAYIREQNKNLVKVDEDILKSNINDFMTAAGRQDWVQAQNAIVAIKQLGVKIPFKVTLLIKNFRSLEIMGHRAGFRGLREMLSYVPGHN